MILSNTFYDYYDSDYIILIRQKHSSNFLPIFYLKKKNEERMFLLNPKTTLKGCQEDEYRVEMSFNFTPIFI